MQNNLDSMFKSLGKQCYKLNQTTYVAEFPPRLSYFAKNLGNRTVDLFNH